MNVPEMGMPLVLKPKTLPMEMFHPKCQPRANPKRPPVNNTLRPPAMPPMKMFNMLCHWVPPGLWRCITTKNVDCATMAQMKAVSGVRPRPLPKDCARFVSIQPRTGNSSFKATFKWNTTSQNMHVAKRSLLSKTSKKRKKWIHPAHSSAANMHPTITMPTKKPQPMSAKKGASMVKPNAETGRLSIHRDVQTTASTEPIVMPKRMNASFIRLLAGTWFRKKGWPFLSAKTLRSPTNNSFAGHGIVGSCDRLSSMVISAPKGRDSPAYRLATCNMIKARNSFADACARRKKISLTQMLMMLPPSPAKASFCERMWPML
mmetsp:Transcript_126176/g.353326  ORF Transcript_126176/g.353326 Transcript_126176/m.353326 type:complete len:318 (-) Transcript_126176:189-1142(-)